MFTHLISYRRRYRREHVRVTPDFVSQYVDRSVKLTWPACILLLLFTSFSIQCKEIKVAIDPLGYRPYYFNENGTIKGAVIDMIERIARQLGHTARYEEYPWPRMQQYLKSGRVDMLPIYLKTQDRIKYATFPEVPSFYETYYFYALINKQRSFDGSLHSIAGLSVGEVRGYSYGADYDTFTLFKRIKVGSEGQLLGMLLRSRVDLIIANQAVIDNHMSKMEVTHKIERLLPMFAKTPAYFAFSKAVAGNEALAVEFSDALKKFVKTQEYRDILHKYGIEDF